MIGVDAAEVLDTTMARHSIERMTVIRKWDDPCGAHVWTVRIASSFDAFVIESGMWRELPHAMHDALRMLAEARREAAQESSRR